MSKQSRLNKKIYKYWVNKLETKDDEVEKISQRGFFMSDCSSPPLRLVAVCSLQISQKPIYKVLDSINLFTIECINPVFSNVFFMQLEKTIHEFELSGLRSHARDLRKLGRVIATMQDNRDWKDHWASEIDRNLISAIRDEPFLPQEG